MNAECYLLKKSKNSKNLFLLAFGPTILFLQICIYEVITLKGIFIFDFFYKKISHVIFSLKSSDKRFNIQKKAKYSYVKIFLDFGYIITLRLVESVRKYNIHTTEKVFHFIDKYIKKPLKTQVYAW